MAAAAQLAPVVTPSLSPLDIDALRSLHPVHIIYNSGPIYTGHIPLQPLPGESPPGHVHQADNTSTPAAPGALPRRRPAAPAAPAPPEPPQPVPPAPPVPPQPAPLANPPHNLDPPVPLHPLLYDGSLTWDTRHDAAHARVRHEMVGALYRPDLDVDATLTHSASLRIAYYCCPPGNRPEPFPEHWGPIDVYPTARRTGQGQWSELRGGFFVWQWHTEPHSAKLTVGTVLRAIYQYLRMPVEGGRTRIDYLHASLFAGISATEDGDLILRMHQSSA